MSYDIDGKPLFDPYRIESVGPQWDPHREYPEPEPACDVIYRDPNAGDPLECSCPPRRCICTRTAGKPAPYPADMLERIERDAWLATTYTCDQCGAAGAITVTDAGDFCSCGAEVQA